MTTPIERRRHPRYQATWPVSFSVGHIHGDGTLLDISQGGCAILASQIVPSGAMLDLRLTPHQQHPSRFIRVELAEVRWSSGRLLGLCFHRLDSHALASLLASIRDLSVRSPSPDPESS